jgi:TolB-like protein
MDRAVDPGMRRRRALAVGVTGLVVLAALGGLYLLSQKAKEARSSQAASQASGQARAQRRAVAVLGFKNLSGKPQCAWLSTALSEMLTTELAAGERLRTVPGEAVSRAKLELGVPDAESLAPDTLAKIRSNLGADFVVMGSYLALGDPSGSVRLDVRLQDAAAGETLAALAETGTEDRLFDLASSAGAALRAKLGAGSVTATEAAAAQAGLPSGPEAARLYARGLESMRRFEFAQAKDEMERLVALSPGSPLAHAALADAWSSMGYMDNARAETRRPSTSRACPGRNTLHRARFREANASGTKPRVYRSL